MTVQELTSDSDRYRLIHVLHHHDIHNFVRTYYGTNTSWVLFFKIVFYGLLFFSLAMLLFWGISGVLSLGQLLAAIGCGLLSFILLIPLHELIHGIFYKLMGAQKVRFGAIWRKLAFYAEAPDFVVDYKKFFPVAVAPFFIINTLLIAWLCWHWQTPYQMTIGMIALCLHTMGCIGDFTMLGLKTKSQNATKIKNQMYQ